MLKFFSKSASFSQLLRRTFFLSETELGYAPDGRIPIKPFNVT